MESVIREGALRLLTTESSCDVILSCQGQRLMAHKVILSMASPVFRELLLEDTTDPTVIILPDVASHTMSLILDYFYTGSAIVYSNTLQNFLSLAKFLKIQLDISNQIIHKSEAIKNDKIEKTKKKLPELIPIQQIKSMHKLKNNRRTNSCILPSPWQPRVETVFGNPRDDLEKSEYLIPQDIPHSKYIENDSNNNFQLPLLSNYYYQHNRPKIKKPNEGYCLQNTPLCSSMFLNLNQNNNKLNTTISRPPEEVALDRDKTEHWVVNKTQNNICTSSTIINEIDNDNLKEDSNSSTQDTEFINVVEEEITCKVNELEKSNDKEKPFKCEDCGKHFSQLRNFKYHRSVHQGTKEFAAKCLECGKIFNDKGYLSSHMKIHRDKKEYACPHCPKRFNQRVAYNMHLRIHTGIKPHECTTCGKSFSRKMLLKQHQRVHTGERPYSCPECGKTFADRSNMSLHARLHTGVKPYACSLCPKSFTKKHHLKTHMNFHTGLKPYKCEKCDLAFSQSSNMRTHYKKCLGKRYNNNNNPEQSVALNEEENKKH